MSINSSQSRYFRASLFAILLLGFNCGLLACGETSPTTFPIIPSLAQVTALNTPYVTTADSPTHTVTTPPVITTTNIHNGTLGQIFPALTNLSLIATAIYLQNDSEQMGRPSSIKAHYSLERQGDQFEGEALFLIDGFSKNATQAARNIVIPPDTAQSFLRIMSQIYMEEGYYAPTTTTDYAPSKSIIIQTSVGTLAFFSRSSTLNYTPWGFSFAGRTFIFNSDTPGIALAGLKPYLQKDVLDQLINKAEYAPTRTSKPTANGIATPTIASPLQKGSLGQVLPFLSKLPNTLGFIYYWTAKTSYSPLTAVYSLNQMGSQFQGEVTFSTSSNDRKEAITSVIIPVNIVRDFLQILAQSQAEETQNNSRMSSYDSLFDIFVDAEEGGVRISSIIQSGVVSCEAIYDDSDSSVERRFFKLDSNSIAKALTKISPYLEQNTLKSLAQATSGPGFTYP